MAIVVEASMGHGCTQGFCLSAPEFMGYLEDQPEGSIVGRAGSWAYDPIQYAAVRKYQHMLKDHEWIEVTWNDHCGAILSHVRRARTGVRSGGRTYYRREIVHSHTLCAQLRRFVRIVDASYPIRAFVSREDALAILKCAMTCADDEACMLVTANSRTKTH